jgi:hypothetical protein
MLRWRLEGIAADAGLVLYNLDFLIRRVSAYICKPVPAPNNNDRSHA